MGQIIEESVFDGYDRTFLDWSSRVAEPFCKAHEFVRYRSIAPLDPNKFDNSASKVKEIATRVLIALTSILSFTFAGTHLLLSVLVLGAVCKVFRVLGIALQKQGFTHVRGLFPEKVLSQGQAKVMTWKLCGDCTGLHYTKEGVIQWRSRLDRIADKIIHEDPDILVLQQVYDTALAEALIEKLQDRYAHFFIHVGADVWGGTSGCMVITKCAVQNFTHTEFGDDWNKRWFATFEIKASPNDLDPCLRIIGAELSQGKEAAKRRMEQFTRMIDTLSRQKLSLPTLFAGNIHGDSDSPEEIALLAKYLHHSYRGNEPTHTDELVLQWDPRVTSSRAMTDFISLFRRLLSDGKTLPVVEKGVRLIDCHLVKAFDKTYNTKYALSNCHGVSATIGGLKKAY